MLYALYGSTLLASAFAIPSRNKLLKKFVLCFTFVFMFILLGWAAGAYDVEIGISRYVNYKQYTSFTEIGYNLLVVLGHKIGLNYRAFFVICSFFELLVLFWFVEKNSIKPQLVLFLFLLYPLVFYFQYIRNILAFSFVLIGFDRLINKKKAYIFRYIVLVGLATTIHFSSLFFLLYLPFAFLKKRTAIIVTLLLCITLYSASSIQFLADFLTEFLGETKTDIVLGSAAATGSFGRIFALLFSIAEFFVLYFLLKSLYKLPMDDEYAKLFFNMNLLLFLLIPLTLNLGVGFSRISTLMSVFNYTFFVNEIGRLKRQGNRIFSYGILLLFLLGLFVLNFRNLEYRQLVLYPFFEENELISKLLG